MYAVFALVRRFDQGTMSLVFRNRLTGRHLPNPFIGELNQCYSTADSVSLIFVLCVMLLRSIPKGQVATSSCRCRWAPVIV